MKYIAVLKCWTGKEWPGRARRDSKKIVTVLQNKQKNTRCGSLHFLTLPFLMCSRLLSLAQGFCSGDVTECRLRGSAAAPWANHRFSVLSPFDGCGMCGSTRIMHVAGSRLNCNELFSVRRPLREPGRQCVWQIRWQAYCLGWLPLTNMFVTEPCDYWLFKGLQVGKKEWIVKVVEERKEKDFVMI